MEVSDSFYAHEHREREREREMPSISHCGCSSSHLLTVTLGETWSHKFPGPSQTLTYRHGEREQNDFYLSN